MSGYIEPDAVGPRIVHALERIADAIEASDSADLRVAHAFAKGVDSGLKAAPAPPTGRPVVYEHLATQERHDGEHVTVTSLCGKVWKPIKRSEIHVLGRCPDCEEHVKARWVA